MKHFQASEWADLARGAAAAEAAQTMRAHLQQGCKSCQAMFDGLKAVVEVSQWEAPCEPPEGAVRSVKAMFSLVQPKREQAVAGLVFDNFSRAATAGVRSSGAPARQFVFESGGIVVDVKLDPLPGSNLVNILGQVMEKHDSYGIGCIPVALRHGAQQVAKTFSNRFGEFQFEARMSADLTLVFVLPESRLVEVPLGKAEGSAMA